MRRTPTSASWLNRVERPARQGNWDQVLRDITVERRCRGVFIGVPALAATMDEHIAHHNTKPKAFIWVKSVADLLQKVIRASSRLSFEQNATRHGPVRKTGRRCRTGT